jgi:hypothetical protein
LFADVVDRVGPVVALELAAAREPPPLPPARRLRRLLVVLLVVVDLALVVDDVDVLVDDVLPEVLGLLLLCVPPLLLRRARTGRRPRPLPPGQPRRLPRRVPRRVHAAPGRTLVGGVVLLRRLPISHRPSGNLVVIISCCTVKIMLKLLNHGGGRNFAFLAAASAALMRATVSFGYRSLRALMSVTFTTAGSGQTGGRSFGHG